VLALAPRGGSSTLSHTAVGTLSDAAAALRKMSGEDICQLQVQLDGLNVGDLYEIDKPT
jgi:hypothetical protein